MSNDPKNHNIVCKNNCVFTRNSIIFFSIQNQGWAELGTSLMMGIISCVSSSDGFISSKTSHTEFIFMVFIKALE